jgi:hypothetical protein
MSLPFIASRPGEETLRRRGHPPWEIMAVWLLVVVVALGFLLHLGRTQTFYADEWNFVSERWQFSLDTFLGPHNGHLSLVPATAFFVLFRTVGLDSYPVFRVAGLLVHAAVASAVAWYVWQRRGQLAAFGTGVAILLLGTGWQNIMWPFQIGFMGSVLGFVGALIAMDRGTTRGDVVAGVLVAMALASSSVGIPAALAVLLGLLVDRSTRRRWWIGGVPLALYAVWYVLLGESTETSRDVGAVPDYVSRSAAGATAGLFDLRIEWGFLLAGLLLGLGIAIVVRERAVSARVVTLSSMLLIFWTLTAVSRGVFGEPAASRYVYVGAVVIVLLVVEMTPATKPRPVALALLVLGLVSGWATNDLLRAGAGGMRYEGELMVAQLAVLEAYRPYVDPDHQVDTRAAPSLLAGPYFAAVDNLGSSPADPITTAGSWNELARQAADRVLREVAPIEVAVLSDPGAPAPACTPGTPTPERLTLDGGSVVVFDSGEPLEVRISRFSSEPSEEPFAVIPAGATVAISVPSDDAPEPWELHLAVGSTDGATPVSDATYCRA